MIGPIHALETTIQTLLEQNLVALLRRHIDIPTLALELAKTLEQSYSSHSDQSKRPVAPHNYILIIHPKTIAKIKSQTPDIESIVATQILTIVNMLEMPIIQTPTIQIIADETIQQGSVKILPQTVDPSTAATVQMTPLNLNSLTSADTIMAHIIVNGDYYHPLSEPLVTIGRKLDNNIILEDPDVSRSHAQVRMRMNKWVLFDTNSRLGTQVNNKPIKEQVLQNGDVISIGSTTLIFVENDIEQTSEVTSRNQHGGTIPI
tara:strand:+ start:18656 stop:19438 length:783 start_codon:yes stop_codon:yes gene_type:complete